MKTTNDDDRGDDEPDDNELGDDFDPEAWKKLDPRQYDPRRILRDALADSETDDTTPAQPVQTTRPRLDRDQT